MIELDDIAVSYPLPDGTHNEVLGGVSLKIRRGAFVYLIGPTGSGKSSILRLLYRDRLAQRGSIRVGEFDLGDLPRRRIPHLRRSLGVVFQDFQLLPDRSVYDNVAFALRVTGHPRRAIKPRVMRTLAKVGLSHKLRALPHQLSGGEQQRVAIARAIVGEPLVLLADEPTGNLDPAVSREIFELLHKLHQQGMTLLVATHDHRLVRDYPARTLGLLKGQLLEVDPATL